MPVRPAASDSLALNRPLLPIAVRRILLIAASFLLACFCWLMLDEGDSLNAQERAGARAGAVRSAELSADDAVPPRH